MQLSINNYFFSLKKFIIKNELKLLYFFLVLAAFNNLSHFVKKNLLGDRIDFWDFHVYYCGAEYYLKGLVPYGDSSLGILKDCLNPNILLTVNNSPLALEILKFLALINFSNAKFIWIILCIAGIKKIS